MQNRQSPTALMYGGVHPGTASPSSSGAHLSALLDSTEDLVWSTDLEFRLTTFNRAVSDAIRTNFGVTAHAGMTPTEFLPPEKASFWLRVYEKALREGPFRFEYAPADDRLLELSVNPIIVGGNKTGISVFGKKISEKKAPDLLVCNSEEQFRTTFELAPIGIVHQSTEGEWLECNDKICETLGYTKKELLGQSFRQLTAPDDVDETDRYRRRLLSGEIETANFEKRYVRKDGTLIWAEITVSLQHDSCGNPLRFIVLMADIDSRKRAEQKLAGIQDSLRVSEIRYRTIFETSTDAICLIRLGDLKYVDVNQTFIELTGYAREEAIGRTLGELGIFANPDDQDLLKMTLERHSELRNVEVQYCKKDRTRLWGLTSASIMEIDGVPFVLAVTRDITDVKAAEEEIKNLAFYDSLTGLPNRRLLLQRLSRNISVGLRVSDIWALFFIDLDNFKAINDTHGHEVGDLLLREVAGRLSACVRQTDTVARLGGDEFVVVVESLSSNRQTAAAETERIARKLLAAIHRPYTLNGHRWSSTSCIGMAICHGQRKPIEEVMRHAEIAMFSAKAAGRNTIKRFSPSQQDAVRSRVALEEDLRHAIEKNQLVLHYQPQFKHGRLSGVEALLRWAHPQRGILLPGDFIRMAEETGLILPLGNWVLESVCDQLCRWAHEKATAGIRIALNISALQLHHPKFVDRVRRALRSTGATPQNLNLELTETVLIENIANAMTKMEQLRSLGCKLSLDDFGTGYSSLSYLKRLPLDFLKIDRTFVRDITLDRKSKAIARTIIHLGRAMGLSVIAEGVETQEQWNCLRRIGCAEFQGFLFSRPVPLNELTPIFERRSWGITADLDLSADNGLMDVGVPGPAHVQFTEAAIESH